VRPVDTLLDGGGDRVPRLLRKRHVRGAVVVVVEGGTFGGRVVDADSDHVADRSITYSDVVTSQLTDSDRAALAMIAAGATRIGASATREILVDFPDEILQNHSRATTCQDLAN